MAAAADEPNSNQDDARRRLLGVLLLGAVALTTISATNDLLSKMHAADRPSATFESGLYGPPVEVREAIAGWISYEAELERTGADLERTAGQTRSPLTVARIHVLADLLLILAYVLVIRWVIGAIERSIRAAKVGDEAGGDETRDDPEKAETEAVTRAFEKVVDLGRAAVVVLALVDILENLLAWLVLNSEWEERPSTLIPALRVVTVGKFLVIALVAGALAIGIIRLVGARRRKIFETVRLLRTPIALTLLYALLMTMGGQIADVLLDLDVVRGVVAIALACLFALCIWSCAFRVLRRARATQLASDSEEGRLLEQPPIKIRVAVAATPVIYFLIGRLAGVPWKAALVPGIILLAIFAGGLFVPVPKRPLRRPLDDPGAGAFVFARVLAAIVLLVGAYAVLRATLGTLILLAGLPSYDNTELVRVGGGLLMLLLVPASLRVTRSLGEQAEANADATGSPWKDPTYQIFFFVGLVSVALAALCVRWWERVPQAIGALGVLLVFMILVTIVAWIVITVNERYTEKYRLPRLFWVLRLRRVPVFTLLLVWTVVGTIFASEGRYDMRRKESDASGPPAASLTLEEAFDAWVESNGVPDAPSDSTMPLVVVAAEGGGIRAAYWTSLVMDCLFEGHLHRTDDTADAADHCAEDWPETTESLSNHVFLASGISGGSLGLVEYAAYLNEVRRGETPPEDWVDIALVDDYVSPTLAWQLFVEVPRSFLQFESMDRAEVMERSWEESWERGLDRSPLQAGLESTWTREDAARPLLLLNGASALDGCWFNTSLLDLGLDQEQRLPPLESETEGKLVVGGCRSRRPYDPDAVGRGSPSPVDILPRGGAAAPGTNDLVDFLCEDDDIRLSTAALMSARFPGISPSGRVDACPSEDRIGTKFVVDGGYIESSGAEPLMNLWPRLRQLIARQNRQQGACVVPYFIQIDNGSQLPQSSPQTSSPNELLVPLIAGRAPVRSSRAEQARSMAGVAFDRSAPSMAGGAEPGEARPRDHYAHFIPAVRPGVSAPLGWTLSVFAEDVLKNQLTNPLNVASAREVRAWLTNEAPTPRCDAA